VVNIDLPVIYFTMKRLFFKVNKNRNISLLRFQFKLKRILKRRLLFFQGIRIEVIVIFFLCLLFIFAYDFVFINRTEIFHNASKFGKILYSLSFSYIAAFIFFFLIVHIQNYKDRKLVNVQIAHLVNRITMHNSLLFIQLQNACNIKNSYHQAYPTECDLELIVKTLNPNDSEYLVNECQFNGTWINYFDYTKGNTLRSVNKLYRRMRFLDSRLIKILSDLEDCFLFMTLDYINGSQLKDTDFLKMHISIKDYIKTLVELKDYYEKKLKYYIVK